MANAPVSAQVLIADVNDHAAVRHSDSPPVFHFAIPPQPLADALDAYGATTGIELLYNSRLTAGLKSPGVRGNMGADVALAELLSGTNLTPAQSLTGVTTLVLSAQSVTYATSSPIHGAMLQLDTMRVEAPMPTDHHFYAVTVGYAIEGALRRDRILRNANYHIDMNVWVTATGGVQNFEFLTPGRDAKLHSTIAMIVRHVTIGQAPPEDLPQPVHVQILANGAN
ncbi:MAG TPA: STN domain-containing protein [Rhizomicrobium sp.]|nr:STN domain-containing protein [Rhizomicrobium sp.]